MKLHSLLFAALPLATPVWADAPKKSFSVVSLNLAKQANASRIVAGLGTVAAVRNADVFLLQEVVHFDGAGASVAGELARALGMHVAVAPAAADVRDQGLAILSRYPIRDREVRALKKCNLRFRSRTRFALAATVESPGGPVRVWNVHLDTRINSAERIEQLAPVLDDAHSVRGPKIIGGDFNTNGFYWLANVLPVPWLEDQAETVRQSMHARGYTAPLQTAHATFDHLKMHLDWIYQQELEARGAAVHPMLFSDHHALVVQFRL